ncbi:MAG: hypothetical protein M1839_000045 [Geoglossum umbratile]|nr:MAG: hypothetical protein M1839_000045 [Geoglossum umbratile]
MNIKRPLPRLPREDISNPAIEDFVGLALIRMLHIVAPSFENPPPRLFPLAESLRWDFFTFGDWDEYGDVETEHGRLAYTLSTYPERGAPSASENTLQSLLSQASVLVEWPGVVPTLKMHAEAALEYVSDRQCNCTSGRGCTTKSDYLTVPVDYEAGESAPGISLLLWKRSLRDIAKQLAKGCSTGAVEFLQIHAYLKDPIYGLNRSLKMQHFFFTHLLNKFQTKISMDCLSLGDLERVAAQAVQESAYLTCPLLERTTLIHFQAHHQLPYADVPLDSLARAEFSVPSHVLEVAKEMLQAAAANDGQACPIVPILVTTRPSFSNNDGYLTPIIDGNHRAAASLLLRFLANEPSFTDFSIMSQNLLEYCHVHHLGRKWEIDLSDALNDLYNHSSCEFYQYFLANHQIVRKFAQVKYIPALVVQEEDFHTICKQRSVGKPKPVLLHPFHQTLFNDDELSFALPQKAGQTHGRPEAFRLLSLSPFGKPKWLRDQRERDF